MDDSAVARRSNTGIDDRNMNRSGWKRLVRRQQRERTLSDILWRNLVGEVDNGY